jgi:hypothetical protein
MTKTKLLLTGLLAGAVAFGTACKTDKAATNTDTTTPLGTDAGMGGAGYDHPDHSRQGTNPVPEEGTREMEPDVHEGTHDMPPGTGGTGLEDEPMNESDNPTGDEPLNPGSPTTEPLPQDEGLLDDEATGDEPRQ